MRQVLYVSQSARPHDQAALDGVTGLLWSDGRRFAQVIEGDDNAIADVMKRIRLDPRHRAIEVLHDHSIADRQFGTWSMELRTAAAPADQFDERLRRMLAEASDTIRRTFAGLVASA